MNSNTRRTLLLCLALGAQGGCYQGLAYTPDWDSGATDDGDDGDDSADDVPEPVSEADEVAEMPLPRLTRHELRHTLTDLLGAPFETDLALPSDARGIHGFIEGDAVSTVDARNLMNLAEAFAAEVKTGSPLLEPCDPSTTGEVECAERFVERFGRRAYRRHLEPEEVTALVSLYEDARAVAELDHDEGIAAVTEAMVQSPHFLYRRELGPRAAQEVEGVVVLDPDEVASRLSYLLWSSLPDDALFAAADARALASSEQLEAQARRMLDDPRADRMVDDFHLQWLDIEEISTAVKDVDAFPAATEELMGSMEEETRRFARWVMLGDGDGTLEQLLTAPTSLVDARLAALYGVDAPAQPFTPTALDPSERAGILTQPAFLARHAGTALSNPARRGKTLSERLLCRALPPPPDDIPALVPPEEGATTRQQFEQHALDPACRGCHQLIDPLGFSLEHYDAIGGYRQQEQGTPIDASGSLDLDGDTLSFSSMVELAPRLAGSAHVRECVATQWFRYAMGRAELDADQTSRTMIYETFEDSGFDLRELIVAIVTSPSFRERAPSEGEELRQ